MKFVIPATNVKTFARSVFSLSKLGDEIYIEPLEDSLTLRTVNSSRSAFSCFSFKRSFFTFFEPNSSPRMRSAAADQTLNTTAAFHDSTNNHQQNRRGGTANGDVTVMEEQQEVFKCKVPSKCLLSIFRNINSLEKNLEKCTITVKYIPMSDETAAKVADYETTLITKMVNQNNEEILYDTKFLIIMSSKYGVRKTFILSISDCESLQTTFATESCTNKLNISAKYLHETINSFSNDTEEITFMVEANKLVIKNYVELETSDSKPSINTQVNFDSDEFNNYEIESESDITFCLKEFKICLLFGFYFDLPLDIYFIRKGRPIIFLYHHNEPNAHFEANFTLATLAEDPNSQTTTAMSSLAPLNRSTTTTTSTTTVSNHRTNSVLKPAASSRANNKNNNNNKQILFDGEVYLGGDHETTTVANNNENNSADDDQLLTQALAFQEERQSQQQQKKQQQQQSKLVDLDDEMDHEKAAPPSKKLKSLIQTIFEDEDGNEADDGERRKKEEKETNNFLKSKHGLVSLGQLLQASSSEEEDQNDDQVERKNAQNSVYIENTDSE